MTGQVLQADLDALRRLKPDIERLTEEVVRGLPSEVPVGPAGASPSLAAAQQMSTQTLPAALHAFADRLTKLAEMVELARAGLIAAEGQLLSGVSETSSASRTSTIV